MKERERDVKLVIVLLRGRAEGDFEGKISPNWLYNKIYTYKEVASFLGEVFPKRNEKVLGLLVG